MAPAQYVGWVFFPLDEELALLPGSLTPREHEHLVHLATWMPFERTGVHSEAVQTAQSQEAEPEENEASAPLKQAISSDGASVPLLSGEWAEVRTGAIGEVETHTRAQGDEQVKVTHLSYFSRMTDAERFEQLAEVEIRRRRVRDAQSMCAVTDGAVWLQHFIDLHRPEAVRILDFAHAAEYVSAIGEAVRESRAALTQHMARWRVASAQTRGTKSGPQASEPPGRALPGSRGGQETALFSQPPRSDGSHQPINKWAGQSARGWWSVRTSW